MILAEHEQPPPELIEFLRLDDPAKDAERFWSDLNAWFRDPDDGSVLAGWRGFCFPAALPGYRQPGRERPPGPRLAAIVGKGGPRTFVGDRFIGHADLRGAVFHCPASFYGAKFEGTSSFVGARFTAGADFGSATFNELTEFGGVVADGANFRGAVFGPVSFEGAALGSAWFNEGRFGSRADFDRATFDGPAVFAGARFDGEPSFDQTRFGGQADFTGSIYDDQVSFTAATFAEEAWFGRARFNGPTAVFNEATFAGMVSFLEARFLGWGRFDRTRFLQPANLAATFCGPGGSFAGASFDTGQTFGLVQVLNGLDLDGAVFKGPVRAMIDAGQLSCRGTRFPGGIHMELRRAEAVFDEAEFGPASLVLGAAGTGPRDACPGEHSAAPPQRPRLLSLRGATVGDLVLSNIDLRACRFHGAHHLDGLRIEGEAFALAPTGGSFGRWPLRRWTSRRFLAEEGQWRNGRGSHEWYPPECQLPEWASLLMSSEEAGAPQIATVYRALRKGREDNRDAPGAADFYYGEMEMRRSSTRRFSPEWLVLSLYWLSSGYALRSGRALLGLLLTIAVFATLFWAFGFDAAVPFARALTYTAGTATNLLGGPDRALTITGEVLHICVRILGPLFLGLAVVSLRGRISR